MPELPEAETIARGLRTALAGCRFASVVCVRAEVVKTGARLLRRAVAGARVEGVSRRGKRVIVHLEGAHRLIFALGMTGRITVEAGGAECLPHTHLRIGLDDGARELRFRDVRRFGGVWLANGDGERGAVGPGPLGAEPMEIRLAAFGRLMRRGRQVKALLMDQRVLAGLGNIYCDEALHLAGIHPLTRAGDLSEARVADLRRAIRRVLRAAIKCEGSTFMDYRGVDGRPGGFQLKHRVYGLAGEPCRTCGAVIERIQAAGRSTHYCPGCQTIGTRN